MIFRLYMLMTISQATEFSQIIQMLGQAPYPNQQELQVACIKSDTAHDRPVTHSYSIVPAACLWFLSNLLLRLLSAGSSPPAVPVPLGLIPDHVP
jgi:hypothetical protein